MSEQDLLNLVEVTRRELEQAKTSYVSAVISAHESGISNVRIAGRAGVTETAIRQMVKKRRSDAA